MAAAQKLSRDGWNGQQIADELGWTKQQVSQYSLIKERLYPTAWDMARCPSTNNGKLVDTDNDAMVDWKERHFRALLKHLSYKDNDRAVMRAQIKANYTSKHRI